MSADDTPSIKPDRSKDAADFKLEPHDMSWFERPGTVKPLVFALYAACVIFLLLDALILPPRQDRNRKPVWLLCGRRLPELRRDRSSLVRRQQDPPPIRGGQQ